MPNNWGFNNYEAFRPHAGVIIGPYYGPITYGAPNLLGAHIMCAFGPIMAQMRIPGKNFENASHFQRKQQFRPLGLNYRALGL